MYIQPDTNIRILKNVPIDSSYTHTLWFDTSTAQSTYFTSLIRYNLVQHTYQRVNKNTMRVQIKYESLYDCNYMMFQNASFGDKWFYAFILNVNYINDVTSEIVYAIDVIQTWLFDYTINRCTVVREHSLTDNIGDNLVDEGLDVGTLINIGGTSITDLNELSIVLCTTHDLDGEVVAGHIWNKVYTGFNYFVAPATEEGAQTMNRIIEYIVENHGADGIVGCCVCPSKIAIINNAVWSFNFGKNRGTIAGNYTPKNKKLYTYPYNFLQVTNGQGQSVDYRYEYFDDKTTSTMEFEYIGTCDLSPSVYLYPHSSYKGKSNNYNEGISLSNFPQCATTADSYKAWLAQNGQRTFASYGSGIVKSASSFVGSMLQNKIPGSSVTQTMTGSESYVGGMSVLPSFGANVYGGSNNTMSYSVKESTGGTTSGTKTAGALDYLTDVGTTLWSAYALRKDLEALPPTYQGTQNGSINVMLNRQTFTFERKSVNLDYAKRIDDFFSMYGYATGQVKVPNRSSRPHWNYVKTIGCSIKGNIPQDDRRLICALHDNGITYWKNGSEVGNYALDNSPT